MERSDAVAEAIAAFYERFSAGDADAFAGGLATCDGVSVIGTEPGGGASDRDEWSAFYRDTLAELGLKLEGERPRGFAEGSLGWGTDRPSFVLPDGSFLPTRMTAILHEEDGDWRMVHAHFSVGVPDEQALQPPLGS